MLNKSILVLVVSVCLGVSLWSMAEISNISLIYPTQSQTVQTFYQNGALNTQLLVEYRDGLEERKSEIAANIEIYFEKFYGQAAAKDALDGEDYLVQMDLLIGWVNELIEQQNWSRAKIELEIIKIAEFDIALSSAVVPKNTLEHSIEVFKRFTNRMTIDKSNQNEASNLVDPRTGELFDDAQLLDMRRRGIDLSKLDPPKNNGVVDLSYDISKVDVKKRFLGPEGPLYGDTKVYFPDTNKVYFTSLRKTQSKPKMNIYFFSKKGKKKKAKLKFGAELHAEPTIAALGTALGMYHDKSIYRQNIKVVLGDITVEELRIDWNTYFKAKDFERLVIDQGRDAEGNYIVFRDGLFEAKFKDKELDRIGPWYWGIHGHQERREMRGLALFNVWVNATDVKEGENNKILYKNENGNERLFYMQHDVGFGLGRYFKEKPLDFPWDTVRYERNNRLSFKYRVFQPFSGFEHITMNDAKWMVRRIAQLTRQQIRDAVNLGGWPNIEPYNFRDLLVEKLISRRNDLVKTFGLKGERLANGRVIDIMNVDYSVEKKVKEPPVGGIDGYTIDFRHEVKSELIDPFVERVKTLFNDGKLHLMGALDKISVEPEYLGLDSTVITEVLFNLDRNIIENPNPKSLNDQYIVRDDFTVGIRLGAGIVLTGDISYVRKYSIVYTKPSKDEAYRHPRYLFELFNPYSKIEQKLPENHILISESYLTGRGRLRADIGPVGPGLSLSNSKIRLTRSIVSRKSDDHILVVDDNSLGNEAAFKIYTKLGLSKIHHFKMAKGKGHIDRYQYEIDASELEKIDAVIFKNDFSSLKKIAKVTAVNSDFLYEKRDLNLLGILEKKRRKRLDQMKITRFDPKTGRRDYEFQFQADLTKEDAWKFLKDGEEHVKTIQFSSTFDSVRKEIKSPGISMFIEHKDKNVVQKEFFDAYLGFVDGLANEINFLNFSPQAHNPWDSWGELSFVTEIHYNKSAIDRILNIQKLELFNLAFKETNISRHQLKYFPKNYRKTKNGNRFLYVALNGRRYDAHLLMEAINDFFEKRDRALKEKTLLKKVDYVVEALHEAVFRSNGGYNPVLLGAINQTIGEDSYYMESMVRPPKNVENPFPAGVILYNYKGILDYEALTAKRILFDMEEALDIYQAF